MSPDIKYPLAILAILATATNAYRLPYAALLSNDPVEHATLLSSKVVHHSSPVNKGDVDGCAASVRWLDLEGFAPVEGSWFRISYSPESCVGLVVRSNGIDSVDAAVGCDPINFTSDGHALGTCGSESAGVRNGDYYQSFVIVDPEYEEIDDIEIVTSPMFTISTAKHVAASPSTRKLAARGNNNNGGRGNSNNNHNDGHGSGGHSTPSSTPKPSASAHHQKRQTGEQLLLGVFGGGEASCAAGLTACQVFGRSSVFECLDLSTDIENCGICPNAFFGSNDCTSIDNVDDVSCRAGICHVQSCEDGFAPSADATGCTAA